MLHFEGGMRERTATRGIVSESQNVRDAKRYSFASKMGKLKAMAGKTKSTTLKYTYCGHAVPLGVW